MARENASEIFLAACQTARQWIWKAFCGTVASTVAVLCAWPLTGRSTGIIEMPVNNVITGAFGGEDGSTLYVTTASLNAPESEKLGSLFVLDDRNP
jgi:sugar lactone lactonase YvrE